MYSQLLAARRIGDRPKSVERYHDIYLVNSIYKMAVILLRHVWLLLYMVEYSGETSVRIYRFSFSLHSNSGH